MIILHSACDHITLNFERQDGNSLQIVVQLEVLDCISLYLTHYIFKRQEEPLFKFFCMKERLDLHVIKVCLNSLFRSERPRSPIFWPSLGHVYASWIHNQA